MEAARWARLRALFDETLDQPPAERARWAEASTEGEPELRAELLKLLAAERRPSEALESGALQHVPTWDAEELIGRDVGGYVIEGVLGRGGMGVVYRARQRSPRRSVALKTLSCPLASVQEARRFQLEIEVLGSLQHRAIAQVHEAGTLPLVDGRELPFVAMEVVEGALEVTRYADAHGLALRERTALLREACAGIHHAHRCGIVHRDVKPGNLLVDASGQVKVIDFGIARIIGDSALSGAGTVAGSVLGTLDYMSPEHVSGSPQDVDVRSDVFGLGCVLLELVTGRPPRRLTGLSLPQALARIAHEPLHPPRNLPRALRAVLGRALSPAADARYPSAGELAADLQRFERGEAVHALQGHTLAIVAGFSRRHRVVIAALLAVIVALGLGLYRTNEARRDAVSAELEARAEADVSHGIATALSTVLSSVQPFISGREARVVDVLYDLEGGLATIPEPRARAAVGSVLGQAFLNMWDFVRAGPILKRSLEELTELEPEDSPRRILALAGYADFLEQSGRYAESLELSREGYELALRRLGPGSFTTGYLGTNTAICLTRLGAFGEAAEIYRAIAERSEAQAKRNVAFECANRERLAQVLLALQRPADALAEVERIQAVVDSTGGSRSLFNVALKSTRADVLRELGRRDESLALQREVLTAYELRSDSLANATIAALDVAGLLAELGLTDEAEAVLAARQQNLAQLEAEPGRFHADWALVEGSVALRGGDAARARAATRRALELGARLCPEGWPSAPFAARNLAAAERATGERDAALATVRAGLAIGERFYPVASAPVLELVRCELCLLEELGRTSEARAVRERWAARLEDSIKRASLEDTSDAFVSTQSSSGD